MASRQVRASVRGGIRVNLHRQCWIETVEVSFLAGRPWWLPFPRELKPSPETAQLVQGPVWDPVELRPHSVPAFYRDLAGYAARWPNATVVSVFTEIMASHGIVPDRYLEAIYYIVNQRCVLTRICICDHPRAQTRCRYSASTQRRAVYSSFVTNIGKYFGSETALRCAII